MTSLGFLSSPVFMGSKRSPVQKPPSVCVKCHLKQEQADSAGGSDKPATTETIIIITRKKQIRCEVVCGLRCGVIPVVVKIQICGSRF